MPAPPHVSHAGMQPPAVAWQLTAVWWYLLYFGSQVALLPFLTAWFADQGIRAQQLGFINAFRPWISLPCSFLWGALADHLGAHRVIMLSCFVLATAVRCLLLKVHTFGSIMALVLTMQVLSTPVGVLADAAVVATCRDGEYGLYRKWGAVGWGVMSTVSGAAIDRWGMQAALLLHVLLALPCLYLGWRLHQPHPPGATPLDLHSTTRHPAVPGKQGDEYDGTSAAGDEVHALLGGAGRADHDSPEAAQPLSAQQHRASRSRQHKVAHLLRQALQTQGESEGRTEDAAADVQGAAGVAILSTRTRSGSSCDVAQQEQGEAGGDADTSQVAVAVPCCRTGPQSPAAWDAASDDGQAGQPHSKQAALPISTHASIDRPAAASSGTRAGLRQLLADKQVMVFLATATLMGCGFGLIDTFLFPFLASLGASQLLMGLTLTITCAAEVPVFEIQSRLLATASVDRLLDVVVVVYALRMLAYACLPAWHSVWAVLPVEVLHGITFGLGWGVGTTNCKRLAPPGLAATMQGIFQGCYFGFGYGLGALFGGVVSDRHGFSYMYMSGAGLMLLGWGCLGCARAAASGRLHVLLDWLSSNRPGSPVDASGRAQYELIEVCSG